MTRNKNISRGVLRMEKIRKILKLSESGFSQREISDTTGVSKSTVQEYLRKSCITETTYQISASLDDESLKLRLGCKTPGSARNSVTEAPDFAKVHRELSTHKGVTLELLWKEWFKGVERGYSYTTFCRRYREWLKPQGVSLKSSYNGGEKLFVDFSGVVVPYREKGAEAKFAEIFVGVLGASNYTFCCACRSQNSFDWIQVNVKMLEFLGGVPSVIVSDNLKSAVIKAHRYSPELNKLYDEFSKHYSTTVIPARVRKPQDKAKVEKGVQQIQREVLAPLRDETFCSIGEINAKIVPLLRELNNRKMRSYAASRAELFQQVDKPHLCPLPEIRFTPQRWNQCRVSMDYHIQVEHCYYSVPFSYVKSKVWVKTTPELVEIFIDNKLIATHKKIFCKFKHSTKAVHMPPNHKAVTQLSAAYFTEWAQGIGSYTKELVVRILSMNQHPEVGYRSILGIKRLGSKYGASYLEIASRKALESKTISQRQVKVILETMNTSTAEHKNIRGSGYYQ